MKKLFVKTYGCQMNAYDSARMADLLAPLGYAAADAPEDADMVILNTCHIREKAAEKVYSELGRLKRPEGRKGEDRRAHDRSRWRAASAQAEGEEIVARAARGRSGGGAAILSPPAGDDRARRARHQGACAGSRFSGAGEIRFAWPKPSPTTGVSAFLTVQEGCDKFCTFCVVPYTRGPRTFAPARKPFWREARQLVGTRRARDRAAGPERQCLSRHDAAWTGRWPDCATRSPISKALRASATPPAIPATWPTT